MKVWVFVEGESDRIALETLWSRWRQSLRKAGWGIQVIPLQNKARYFRKIGHHAAEKLVNDERDLAVGLPDLYPSGEYDSTEYRHSDLNELRAVQERLVSEAIKTTFGQSHARAKAALMRFHPTAFKHDAEMLLLAAAEALNEFLGTDALGNWRHPVEDQDQQRPPKRVVEELFRTKGRKRYCDTIHTKAVLEKVVNIRNLIYHTSRQLECPVFKETMDWIGARTGVAAYQ